MNIFERILYWIVFPFEKFLRFWFPYKFKNDPYDPEPQTKEERKKRKLERKRRKQIKDDDDDGTSEDDIVESDIEPTETEDDTALKQLDNLTKPKEKRPKLGLEMVDMNSPLSTKEAYKLIKDTKARITYYYHDSDYHQIAVKFEPRSIKDEYKTRDDAERKKLKPLLFPKQNVPFDRTHVIPVGYHGSESDKRLLVGFNSEINQNELKDFEIRVANINKSKTILWFVSIEKQLDGSALWNATVWSESGTVLKQAKFHDKKEFVWLKGR